MLLAQWKNWLFKPVTLVLCFLYCLFWWNFWCVFFRLVFILSLWPNSDLTATPSVLMTFCTRIGCYTYICFLCLLISRIVYLLASFIPYGCFCWKCTKVGWFFYNFEESSCWQIEALWLSMFWLCSDEEAAVISKLKPIYLMPDFAVISFNLELHIWIL